MSFVDYVRLYLKAGKGGDGVVHWRREKYVPRGGPDGGDGGDGGSIYLEADPHRWTLLELKYKKFIRAPDGEKGKGKCMKGASGKDIILKVPLGTIVKNAADQKVIGELLWPGQRICVARGGKGGQGNHAFRSPTLQAPDFATPGQPGEEITVELELKLLADVGIVGLPNAGKSTLLSVITHAKPKIADYPFTTLTPNIGVVQLAPTRTFVVADIPGIIEGAHAGKGLGLRFLRHIERNALLLFLIPVTSPDPQAEFRLLRRELELYNPELLKKPYVIAFSKADVVPPETYNRFHLDEPAPQLVISAATHYNIENLKEMLYQNLLHHRGKSKFSQPWE